MFLVLPVVLVLAAATTARINIGLRHVLIVYPFLYVVAARLATVRIGRTWIVPGLTGLLAVLLPPFLHYGWRHTSSIQRNRRWPRRRAALFGRLESRLGPGASRPEGLHGSGADCNDLPLVLRLGDARRLRHSLPILCPGVSQWSRPHRMCFPTRRIASCWPSAPPASRARILGTRTSIGGC